MRRHPRPIVIAGATEGLEHGFAEILAGRGDEILQGRSSSRYVLKEVRLKSGKGGGCSY